MNSYHIQPLGESAIQIIFGNTIDLHTNLRVHAAFQAISRAELPAVSHLVPAYASLTLLLDPLAVLLRQTSVADISRQLPLILAQAENHTFIPRLIKLPVYYNGADLARVSLHCGLTEQEVIRRHSSAVYDVYFLGFSPGFAYLGGLDPQLATPRLANPRVQVPAGSVAIGGAQTAVYPQATPGGWNLIGQCAEPLFDVNADNPCRLMAGDKVQFVAVDTLC
jgi:KipI family sensor histidine kinase inhibitor